MRCGVHIPPVDVSQFVAGPSVGPTECGTRTGSKHEENHTVLPKSF